MMPAFVYFTIGEIKNMGYYKDLMQMHQARGYGDSDKYVCQFCFGDTFLKKTILEQGEQGKCSFCKDAKGKPAKRKVLKLEKLMPYIMAAVDYEYEDSIVALPWDSEEKCYMGNSIDFYDFVTEELNAFMEYNKTKDNIIKSLQGKIQYMKKMLLFSLLKNDIVKNREI